MVLEIFNFWWFYGSEKLFISIKLLINLDLQENSAHRFGDNYFTDRLVKFLQDRIKSWRVEARRASAGYHYF